MLQCHPHPGDFCDKSKPYHCSYFMGLQRKQGVPVNVGEQFDIRLTVEEFKNSVNMYTLRKLGMEISVMHVKRRSLPNYVFPGGVRPSRPSKGTWDSRRASELKVPSPAKPEGSDEGRKRKRVDDSVDSHLRNAKCFAAMPSSSGEVREGSPPMSTMSSSSINLKVEHMDANGLAESTREKVENNSTDGVRISRNLVEVSSQNGEMDRPVKVEPLSKTLSVDSSNSKEAEKLAIEKIMSGPYDAQQTFPQEVDELDDNLELKNQVKDFGGNTQGSSMESSTVNAAVTAASVTPINAGGPSSASYPNGSLEELEVLSANSITFTGLFKYLTFPTDSLLVYSVFIAIFTYNYSVPYWLHLLLQMPWVSEFVDLGKHLFFPCFFVCKEKDNGKERVDIGLSRNGL